MTEAGQGRAKVGKQELQQGWGARACHHPLPSQAASLHRQQSCRDPNHHSHMGCQHNTSGSLPCRIIMPLYYPMLQKLLMAREPKACRQGVKCSKHGVLEYTWACARPKLHPPVSTGWKAVASLGTAPDIYRSSATYPQSWLGKLPRGLAALS